MSSPDHHGFLQPAPLSVHQNRGYEQDLGDSVLGLYSLLHSLRDVSPRRIQSASSLSSSALSPYCGDNRFFAYVRRSPCEEPKPLIRGYLLINASSACPTASSPRASAGYAVDRSLTHRPRNGGK